MRDLNIRTAENRQELTRAATLVFPLSALSEKAGLPVGRLALFLRWSGSTRKRLERDGLDAYVADRSAARLGFHPSEVWPEWLEVTP